jgi:predicted 2-oxoglutarate/Fe(II)-dependent dioxygenase YbiX
VFRKNTGGGEFIFKHDVPLDHYSSDTWVRSDVGPGDMVLYPSYLTHAVPPNACDRRTTRAFNAVPHQRDSLGYRIRFTD